MDEKLAQELSLVVKGLRENSPQLYADLLLEVKAQMTMFITMNCVGLIIGSILACYAVSYLKKCIRYADNEVVPDREGIPALIFGILSVGCLIVSLVNLTMCLVNFVSPTLYLLSKIR